MRLPHGDRDEFGFRWDGRAVTACVGDSVAAALYAAGHRVLARSRKFHRPRGLSGAFTAGVLARVDGRPHQRLDAVAARPGLDVRSQNAWPSARFDLLAAARLVPRRWLRAGFEHPRMLASGTRRFEAWERLMRHAAGVAAPPARSAWGAAIAGRRIAADTVVVGGGPAGHAAAARAAQDGGSVVLVSRHAEPGGLARETGVGLTPLPESVTVLAAHDVFALYEGATQVACAPRDGEAGATLIDAGHVVLATGRRSCPPLVPGADLPGVLDWHSALALAQDHAVAPGRRVAVLGSGVEADAAGLLARLGVEIVHAGPVAALHRIAGGSAVAAIALDRAVICDAVVHCGPWRPDPALAFQAGQHGDFRLASTGPGANVTLAGDTAAEPVLVGAALDDRALVCPCMDVTVAEVRALVTGGIDHVEEIKRLTGCGMGPCQGVPCWDLLAAALGEITGRPAEDFGHPTYRPPRAGLTMAQAAGLHGLVEP